MRDHDILHQGLKIQFNIHNTASDVEEFELSFEFKGPQTPHTLLAEKPRDSHLGETEGKQERKKKVYLNLWE